MMARFELKWQVKCNYDTLMNKNFSFRYGSRARRVFLICRQSSLINETKNSHLKKKSIWCPLKLRLRCETRDLDWRPWSVELPDENGRWPHTSDMTRCRWGSTILAKAALAKFFKPAEWNSIRTSTYVDAKPIQMNHRKPRKKMLRKIKRRVLVIAFKGFPDRLSSRFHAKARLDEWWRIL